MLMLVLVLSVLVLMSLIGGVGVGVVSFGGGVVDAAGVVIYSMSMTELVSRKICRFLASRSRFCDGSLSTYDGTSIACALDAFPA